MVVVNRFLLGKREFAGRALDEMAIFLEGVLVVFGCCVVVTLPLLPLEVRPTAEFPTALVVVERGADVGRDNGGLRNRSKGFAFRLVDVVSNAAVVVSFSSTLLGSSVT